MSKLRKILAEETNPESSNEPLTLQDLINNLGEEKISQAILSVYKALCLEPYIWQDIFGEAKLKDLKNMDANEVLFLAQDDEEVTWDEIKTNLGYSYEDDSFSDDIASEITDYFDSNLSDDFEEAFEPFLQEYIKKYHKVNTYDNTHENTYNNTYNNEHNNTYDSTNDEPPPDERDDWEEEEDGDSEEKETIDNASELADLDDKVGDTANLSSKFSIDYPDRDAPFLYIDGEFVEGNSSQSHTQLLNEWCEENGIDQFSEKWYRLPSNKIKQQIDKDKVAFGHIDSGMAFIETCIGCTPEEVLKSIEDAGGYDKVYKWSKNGQTATRLAKVQKQVESKNLYYLKLHKKLFKSNKR